jgi:hypothetical protein
MNMLTPYVQSLMPIALKLEKETGFPAPVLLAQVQKEQPYGVAGHNLFGLKAYGSDGQARPKLNIWDGNTTLYETFECGQVNLNKFQQLIYQGPRNQLPKNLSAVADKNWWTCGPREGYTSASIPNDTHQITILYDRFMKFRSAEEAMRYRVAFAWQAQKLEKRVKGANSVYQAAWILAQNWATAPKYVNSLALLSGQVAQAMGRTNAWPRSLQARPYRSRHQKKK